METRRNYKRTTRKKEFIFQGLSVLGFLLMAILYLELLLRGLTSGPFFNEGLLYSVLFSSGVGIFIYLLGSFIPKKGQGFFFGVLLFLLTFLFASQLIYFKIFRTFYTVFSAQNGGQVLEFIEDIVHAMGRNALGLILIFMPFFMYILLVKRSAEKRYVHTWTERGLVALLLIIVMGGGLLWVNLGAKDVNSAYNLYYQHNYPVASFNKLGLLTSMRLDLQRTALGLETKQAPPPLTEGIPDIPIPVKDEEQGEEEIIVYEDQVLELPFTRLMEETADDTLKQMHAYFSQRTPTKKNQYTGIFEGYNLILITAEAYSHYAIDETLTPTLYKMSEEGFRFTDFYNPLWGVSTSDGEYVATTGLLPKSGVWSMYKSGYISMPYAMGNALRPLGYTTMAYHNHTYDYYNRDISHPNLGYEYKGLGNGLDVTPTWPESDLEMMELTAEEYMGKEPFHAYYMTVSGHMRYDFTGNYIAYKNRDLVKDLPYSEGGQAYMATQIELDLALAHLLEKLEEYGVAENTLIAISGDHYPYGLDKKDLDELAGHEVEETFELYKSSFILYKKGMEPVTIDRPASSLDIIPTIANLLGLSYDSRLYMGQDLLSDIAPKVIFNDRSFITDVGRYDASKNAFTLKEGIVLTEEEQNTYRRAVSQEIDRQFYYSAMILDTDYYSLILPLED